MYTYDQLIFENQNAKILLTYIHMAFPGLIFSVGYMTEEYAVSYYNLLDKNRRLAPVWHTGCTCGPCGRQGIWGRGSDV